MVNLEELILYKEDGVDKEETDLESNHKKVKEEEDEYDNDIEILRARFWGSDQVQVE